MLYSNLKIELMDTEIIIFKTFVLICLRKRSKQLNRCQPCWRQCGSFDVDPSHVIIHTRIKSENNCDLGNGM